MENIQINTINYVYEHICEYKDIDTVVCIEFFYLDNYAISEIFSLFYKSRVVIARINRS